MAGLPIRPVGRPSRKFQFDDYLFQELPMSPTSSILSQVSDSLSELAAASRAFVAAVQTPDGHYASGVLWSANTVVVSEQMLRDAPEYGVRIAGRSLKATLAGRDEGTNVAVLKLESDLPQSLPAAAVAKTGSLALVLGAAPEGVSARLALVRSVGGPWESLAGGTIDQRIVLDTRIGSEEGGPVLAADGAMLGISTRGARHQSLIIPASTVTKSATMLLDKGAVERGWLGLALRPVALPEALQPLDGQRIGLMVMEVASDSPGARAGILAGDILTSVGGVPATRFGNITRQLGPASIGKTLPAIVARAGEIVNRELTIGPRKPA
jgi:S1-C subfamily serine protease